MKADISIYLGEEIDLDDAPEIKKALADKLGDLGIFVDHIEIEGE